MIANDVRRWREGRWLRGGGGVRAWRVVLSYHREASASPIPAARCPPVRTARPPGRGRVRPATAPAGGHAGGPGTQVRYHEDGGVGFALPGFLGRRGGYPQQCPRGQPSARSSSSAHACAAVPAPTAGSVSSPTPATGGCGATPAPVRRSRPGLFGGGAARPRVSGT